MKKNKIAFAIIFFSLWTVQLFPSRWNAFKAGFSSARSWFSGQQHQMFRGLEYTAHKTGCVRTTNQAIAATIAGLGLYSNTQPSQYQNFINGSMKKMGIDPVSAYNEPTMPSSVAAQTRLSGVFTDDDTLKRYPEIYQKHALNHELVHYKYSDVLFRMSFAFGGLTVAGSSIAWLVHYYGYEALCLAPAIIFAFKLSMDSLIAYQESRADTEGAFLTANGCPGCMYDIARIYNKQPDTTYEGYLGSNAYKNFAEELAGRKPMRCCDKHKNFIFSEKPKES